MKQKQSQKKRGEGGGGGGGVWKDDGLETRAVLGKLENLSRHGL